MKDIVIKAAQKENIEDILRLLVQVNQVHADGRPDLFKAGGTKYTHKSLEEKLAKEDEIIFVAMEDNEVVGYIFCVFEKTEDTVNTYGKKTLYIDDLCVDQNHRRKGIGQSLYAHTKNFAKYNGFDRVTLHVWECNPKARMFYESLGMKPMYTAMEEEL